MSKLAILALVFIPACAAGGLHLQREAASTAKVRFSTDEVTSNSAPRAFPRPIEPALPHVDRIAHQIRARFGDDVTAAVELCVSAGRVTKVALAAKSSFDAFDRAVLRDVEKWQFAAMPGPPSLEVCDRATIAYRAPH